MAYWNKLHAMLTRLLTNNLERTVRLFSFWFAFLPAKARPDRYYVRHQFFLGLRHHIIGGVDLNEFIQGNEQLIGKASSYPWYPLIQELFQAHKKGMVEIGQELMKFVQKKIPAQKIDEQAQEFMRTASNEVSSLLTKGIVREQHIQNLPTIYSRLGHELFWTLYTKQFIQLLTAKDIERVLEVYTFWFNESFNYMGKSHILRRNFLSKFPRYLKMP